MSAEPHAGHAPAGDHHDDPGVPHGTRRGYVTGFLLSAVLTAIPFALVMTGVLADARWTAGLVIRALYKDLKASHAAALAAQVNDREKVVLALNAAAARSADVRAA